MGELDGLVEQATRSELFTAPRLAADLQRFLDVHRPAALALAAAARERGVDTAYFVGSGGSWSAMYSGKYLADRFGTLTTDALLSYELIWRNPARLGPRAMVFAASYSGETEDTVAALRHARAAGAWTVGLTNRADATIAIEADEAIAYGSTALYAMPMAAVSLFALEHARLGGSSQAAEVLRAFDALPGLIATAYEREREPGLRSAHALLPAQTLYCVGAGPLYGLAYKFALTVFMENIRTHGSVIESAEVRHGPAEALERQRMDLVVLLGTDESRSLTQRTLEFARGEGARTVVFDAAEYDGLHPLLAPFVLKVGLQWLVVHSALLRGILDLDERVYMGHRVLAQEGAMALDGAPLDVACVGDNCVDVAADSPDEELAGGNALNVAVELARAGRRVTYLGAVGTDARAEVILGAAAAAGLPTQEIRRLPGPTGVTVVARDGAGERSFVAQDYGAGADYRLDPAATRVVASHRWAHFARQPDLAAVAPTLRAAGVRISCDLGVEHEPGMVDELAPHLDVAFLSSSSAPGQDPAELLADALAAGASLAVVTLGAQGSQAASPGARWQADAVAVEAVVDTLGAGDAFIAAFISNLLDAPDDVDGALRAGSGAGAAACTRRGLASPIQAEEVSL